MCKVFSNVLHLMNDEWQTLTFCILSLFVWFSWEKKTKENNEIVVKKVILKVFEWWNQLYNN